MEHLKWNLTFPSVTYDLPARLSHVVFVPCAATPWHGWISPKLGSARQASLFYFLLTGCCSCSILFLLQTRSTSSKYSSVFAFQIDRYAMESLAKSAAHHRAIRITASQSGVTLLNLSPLPATTLMLMLLPSRSASTLPFFSNHFIYLEPTDLAAPPVQPYARLGT